MRRLVGLLLLGGGLGYVLYSNAPSTSDREEQVAAVTRIVAQGTLTEPASVAAEQPDLRQPVVTGSAAPLTGSTAGVPAYAPPSITTASIAPAGPAPDTGAAPTSPLVTDRTGDASAATWQTSVAPVTVTPTPAAAPPHEPGQAARRQLARQIQAELKRVGCYGGTLDGSWGQSSRSAMSAFISRVNASLPTHEPDVILLTLIKGHNGAVCGTTCAPAEAVSGGRCAPRSVLASAEPAGPRYTPPPAAAAAPLAGRMSIGGPKPEPGMARTAPPITGEQLPWLDTPAAAPKAPARTGSGTASPHLAALDDTPMLRRGPAPVTLSPAAIPEAGALQVPPPRRATRPVRVRPAAVKSPAQQRQSQKRRYATRSIQNIFLHPLGRM